MEYMHWTNPTELIYNIDIAKRNTLKAKKASTGSA